MKHIHSSAKYCRFRIPGYGLRTGGFSLVETLIYIAILGFAVVAIVSFSLSMANARSKNYVVQEVQANSRGALNIITQRILAAEEINAGVSTFALDPGVLSLQMADPLKNPTVINLSADNGVLQITQGTEGPISLTSDEVNVTNLVFTNLTPQGSRANIRVEITIKYDNPSGDVEFNYSQTLQTSISLRQ
jgi:type II secretory pathway pseudopilin PulG